MRTPAQAILWQIYWRSRWGFLAAGAFLAVAIALVQLMPTHWKIQLGDEEAPTVGWCLGVSCIFVNVMLMTAFGMSGADARNYTFARQMFVLPVRTRTLVAWPMVAGCLTVAAFWLMNALFVFRSAGIAAPLAWPAVAMALFLATFQALAWTPMAQRWMHVALAVAVLMTPFFVLLLGVVVEVRPSEFAATIVFLALIPIAYLAAHSGISRARRNQPYDWRAWVRFMEWLARSRPPALHPFRSLSRAQLWYECRAHMMTPVMIACLLPCFLFLPGLEPLDVALGWKLLGMLLVAPLLVAGLAGGSLGSLVDPLSKRDTGTFVLVRPISVVALVRGKFVVAAIMTAAIWALFLAFISLLFFRPGFPQSIASVASGFPTWKVVVYPALAFSLLLLFSWKSLVESLWIGLTGRKWVEVANSVGFAGLLLIALCVGLWIFFHPELHAPALAAVPWLLGLLVALKLAAAAFVVNGLLRLGLTTASGAARMAAIWFAIVFSLCALTLVTLPSGITPATNIIAGIVLSIPFARLAGTPLALQWNRHR